MLHHLIARSPRTLREELNHRAIKIVRRVTVRLSRMADLLVSRVVEKWLDSTSMPDIDNSK